MIYSDAMTFRITVSTALSRTQLILLFIQWVISRPLHYAFILFRSLRLRVRRRRKPIVVRFTESDGVCPFCPIEPDDSSNGYHWCKPSTMQPAVSASRSGNGDSSIVGSTAVMETPTEGGFGRHDDKEASEFFVLTTNDQHPAAEPKRYRDKSSSYTASCAKPTMNAEPTLIADDESKENVIYEEHTSAYKRFKWSSTFSSSSSSPDSKAKTSEGNSSSRSRAGVKGIVCEKEENHYDCASSGLKRKRAHRKSRIPLKIVNGGVGSNNRW